VIQWPDVHFVFLPTCYSLTFWWIVKEKNVATSLTLELLIVHKTSTTTELILFWSMRCCLSFLYFVTDIFFLETSNNKIEKEKDWTRKITKGTTLCKISIVVILFTSTNVHFFAYKHIYEVGGRMFNKLRLKWMMC